VSFTIDVNACLYTYNSRLYIHFVLSLKDFRHGIRSRDLCKPNRPTWYIY